MLRIPYCLVALLGCVGCLPLQCGIPFQFYTALLYNTVRIRFYHVRFYQYLQNRLIYFENKQLIIKYYHNVI
jgi:hypothetical protein